MINNEYIPSTPEIVREKFLNSIEKTGSDFINKSGICDVQTAIRSLAAVYRGLWRSIAVCEGARC